MRVGAVEGFHSFQLSKRNLFIENFQSQNLVKKIIAWSGPVRVLTKAYWHVPFNPGVYHTSGH